MLTKEQFFAAGARRYDTVTVPTLGEVRIQSLTEPEKTAYYSDRHGADGKFLPEVFNERSPRLILLSVVGDDGQRIFSPDDLPALIALDASVTEPIFVKARRLSRIDEAAGEGDTETAKKPDSASDTASSGS
ncbi:hypothetical protein [Planctomyces sp. SH-PL14]|uniref:hypothetical protein n=1 Tax=Planctomyces sp. SH-PL14 TaxID=1632864 RepID=UPI00078B8D40|nr:hypothetical protein [Planctomyces sp. SH-PL14]AMV20408.1 hypothetical protein VT03_21095 [Planctomyces sp. SH-PL14]